MKTNKTSLHHRLPCNQGSKPDKCSKDLSLPRVPVSREKVKRVGRDLAEEIEIEDEVDIEEEEEAELRKAREEGRGER